MKSIIAMVLMTFTSFAFAGNMSVPSGAKPTSRGNMMSGTTTATNTQDQTSTSAASTDGNLQAINIEASQIPTDTKATIKNVPSVSGPPLTTSNDTCMGSTSGSVNIAGLGIGGGTTWTDTNCKRLKNSREMWNMGMKAAALAMMCMDEENKTALELTGFECPQTTKARETGKKVQTSSQTTYTDPIVRERMGLPALYTN